MNQPGTQFADYLHQQAHNERVVRAYPYKGYQMNDLRVAPTNSGGGEIHEASESMRRAQSVTSYQTKPSPVTSQTYQQPAEIWTNGNPLRTRTTFLPVSTSVPNLYQPSNSQSHLTGIIIQQPQQVYVGGGLENPVSTNFQNHQQAQFAQNLQRVDVDRKPEQNPNFQPNSAPTYHQTLQNQPSNPPQRDSEKPGSEMAKYAGELEKVCGMLRLENVNMKETIEKLEKGSQSLQNEKEHLIRRLEEVDKESKQLAVIAGKARSFELELEATTEELKQAEAQLLRLRENLFHASFDKFAFESNLKDNANLRQHTMQLAAVIEDMKQNFEEYSKLAKINPEETRKRELLLTSLDQVLCDGLMQRDVENMKQD